MRNRYTFSGTPTSVGTFFISFAKHFGGNPDCTVATIARMYECLDGVNEKTEKEKVVSFSRTFGENPKVIIETDSDGTPSQEELSAILNRIGIVPEIGVVPEIVMSAETD